MFGGGVIITLLPAVFRLFVTLFPVPSVVSAERFLDDGVVCCVNMSLSYLASSGGDDGVSARSNSSPVGVVNLTLFDFFDGADTAVMLSRLFLGGVMKLVPAAPSVASSA